VSFQFGQDVFQVIADLKLTGNLKISKLMSDLYVQGEIEFTGIILSWKLNCDKNSPDYDECGLYPFSLEDFNDEDFPLDLLYGTWNGMVTDQSTLLIDPHTLALKLARNLRCDTLSLLARIDETSCLHWRNRIFSANPKCKHKG